MTGEDNKPSSLPAPASRGTGILILLLLLTAFLLFLFYRGLIDPDEGRYAEIPREMVNGGNWMELRLFGVRYYEKPPLAYWITAIPLRLFGAKDWAARIPLLPAALALAFLGFLIAVRSWGRERGLAAAFTAITTFGLFFAMSMVIPDSYLALWFAATCFLLLNAFAPHAGASQRWTGLLGAAFFMFLGAMTKGIVAVVLPAAILFLWLMWERRLKSLWTLALFAAAVLFLTLIVPATWLLEKHNPGFTQYFYISEHVSRFIGNRRDQVHSEPPWFFLKTLPLLLVPWTLFLFRAVRTMAVKRVLSHDGVSRFLLVWVVVVIGFFSAGSGKLMSYIMPSLLPLSLLIGRWGVAQPLDGSRADRRLWMIGFFPLPVLSILLPVVWVMGWLGMLPETLAVPNFLSVLPLLPAWIVAIFLFLRGFPSFNGIGISVATFYIGMAFLLSPLAGKDMNAKLFRNSAIVFKEFAAQLRPEDHVVMMYHYKPSVAFYTQKIPVLYDLINEMRYGMDAEPGRLNHAENREQMIGQIAAGTGQWFGVVEHEDMDDFIEHGFDPPVSVTTSNVDLKIVDLSTGQATAP
jgi:4-amino-4-deoxy-L-arabinose transferase-like glycosyltransferase